MSASPPSSFRELTWQGHLHPNLDAPKVAFCEHIILGSYGGNSRAGQTKNEDAATVWAANGWEFAALFDAHASSESILAIDELLQDARPAIFSALGTGDLWRVNHEVVSMFRSPEARRRMAAVRGETAFLVCARHGNHLAWVSVGDNLLFLLHDDLAAMGQFALNQRQLFEWVGRVNTFDQDVPSFTQGVRELRYGSNRILMVTDGILEHPGSRFADAQFLAQHFESVDETSIRSALESVHAAGGRDSATIIGWEHFCHHPGALPSV